MTIDKERLRVLAEAATPGPWDSSAELVAIVGGPLFVTNLARGGTRSIVCRIENEVSQRTLDSEDHANAELIAAARDAIPALLSENAALAAEVERLRTNAARYEWLRGQFWHKSNLFVVHGDKSNVMLGTRCPSKSSLDDAIDAAMADKGGRNHDPRS